MQITKEILKKYGITMVDISKATGMHHPTVCNILDEDGYQKIQKEGNRMFEEKKKLFKELIKEL